jgi:hypothetical protein
MKLDAGEVRALIAVYGRGLASCELKDGLKPDAEYLTSIEQLKMWIKRIIDIIDDDTPPIEE